MICLMPVVDIPNDFIDHIDEKAAAGDPVYSSHRRRRSAADRRRRRDIYITEDDGDTMTVYVTLYFDGFKLNVSTVLTNVTLLVPNEPKITVPDDPLAFYPNTSQIVELMFRLWFV